MSKERRLGRGLEALLGRPIQEEPQAAEGQAGLEQGPPPTNPLITKDEQGQQWIDLQVVIPNPYQPRQHFEEAEIADLCDSIRTHGFLQPIVVRQVEGQFQIIAGERRYRAAQLAGWERVPVQVRAVDDRQMAELAIVENVQRKDLNALEKAGSFQRYLQEYQCTQEELASRVNVDRSTIANLIRLLELPAEVKDMVATGEISPGHARTLLPLGDEQEQCGFARQIKQDSLSVRATEQAVQEHIRSADRDSLLVIDQDGETRPATTKKSRQSHLVLLEDQLRLALGTKVDLRQTVKGSGRITIHFKNPEEFERLQALLNSGAGGLREAG